MSSSSPLAIRGIPTKHQRRSVIARVGRGYKYGLECLTSCPSPGGRRAYTEGPTLPLPVRLGRAIGTAGSAELSQPNWGRSLCSAGAWYSLNALYLIRRNSSKNEQAQEKLVQCQRWYPFLPLWDDLSKIFQTSDYAIAAMLISQSSTSLTIPVARGWYTWILAKQENMQIRTRFIRILHRKSMEFIYWKGFIHDLIEFVRPLESSDNRSGGRVEFKQ